MRSLLNGSRGDEKVLIRNPRILQFQGGSIDYAAYKNTANRNILSKVYRLGGTKQWYKPKLKSHADVASKLAMGKSMTVEAVWDMISSMMEQV